MYFILQYTFILFTFQSKVAMTFNSSHCDPKNGAMIYILYRVEKKCYCYDYVL